jgi:hypothetical protein
VSGTEIEEGPDGRFTGKVARHFDKYDKRDFVVEHCRRREWHLENGAQHIAPC